MNIKVLNQRVVVNNSTKIKKTKNLLSRQTNEHTKTLLHMEIQSRAWNNFINLAEISQIIVVPKCLKILIKSHKLYILNIGCHRANVIYRKKLLASQHVQIRSDCCLTPIQIRKNVCRQQYDSSELLVALLSKNLNQIYHKCIIYNIFMH